MVRVIFIIFVFISGLITFPIYNSLINTKEESAKLNSMYIGNYVKQSKELVSYKYFYTNTAMFENKKSVYGFNLPLTSKRFIISYNGKATLGVDLSHVSAEIKGKKIIISNLGEIKILSNELDENSMKIFDESTSLFSSWNIKDYQKFFGDQRLEIEKKIMESELPQQAKTSADETIKQLLMLNPQISSQYEIEFRE